MNSKIVFSTLSNIDLDKIISYYYELNKATAKKYYNEMIALIKNLSEYPLIGRIVPECEDVFYDKYREILYENFRIIYRIEADRIIILRFLDARMDIDFNNFE